MKFDLHQYTKEFARMRWIPVTIGILRVTVGCSSGVSDGIGGTGGVGAVKDSSGVVEDTASGQNELPEYIVKDLIDGHGQASVAAPPSLATKCNSDGQCPTGNCVDGFCCDSKCDNKCMACSAAKKGSGADGICGSIAYDTDPDAECPQGRCDGKNQCKFYNGYSCTSTAQCLSNYCVDGVCCGNICMGPCQACSAAQKGSGSNGVCGNIAAGTNPDAECASGGTCTGAGACSTSITTLANGTACTSAAQCNSGFCADGVCCDNWCLGTCQACTAARKGQGTDGTCGNIANNTDPDEECWSGVCNGAGVCKQYNGVPCSTTFQCLSGYCTDGFCCDTACNGSCQACSVARKAQGSDGVCGAIASGKDPDNECNPGECNGSGTCNQPQKLFPNGAICVTGGQCASGNCVDGYCCDSACTGTCQACSASTKGSGADGTCGNITAETDPENECGVGGRCGGNGTCRYYNGASCASTAQCFSNYCVDGVCCGNICNLSCMACTAVKKGSGSDGACGMIAANADPDNECNPGECNGSGTCGSSCPIMGTAGSCGTPNCPACPPMIVLGSGTTGIRGTFVSSTSPQWSTSAYSNEASMDIPSIASTWSNNEAMGLIRRTDNLMRWMKWTSSGFSGWTTVTINNVPESALAGPMSLVAGKTLFELGYHKTDQTFGVGSFNAASSTWNLGALWYWWGMGNYPKFSGPVPPVYGGGSNDPVAAYTNGTSLNILHFHNGFYGWESQGSAQTSTMRVPSLVAYDDTNHVRDALIVFANNTPTTDQLYWTARTNATWSSAVAIANVQALDQSLLAFPNGDFLLAYRDPNKKVFWTGFSGIGAKWSTPLQIPGALTAKSRPSLAMGAGDAEVELVFVDDATGTGYHARLIKGATNFSTPVAIPGATSLVGIAATTSLCIGCGTTKVTNGTACAASADCISGYCVEGVCCDSACSGTCQSCLKAKNSGGVTGYCSPITIATDPDNECVDGDCTGTGTCTTPGLLPYGSACTASSQCRFGNCVDGVCCQSACTGFCQACSAAKKGSGSDGSCGYVASGGDPENECNPGECNGSGVCNQPQSMPNGASCTLASQCQSSSCVDGVCCDSACTGACQACSAVKKGSGSDGTCGMIAVNTDPDNECPLACNGSGACQQTPNGGTCTVASNCVSGFCVDGVCCDSACTGACQACSAVKKGSGSDGTCGMIAVNTDPDNECTLACNGAGGCQKAPNGVACVSAVDCTSGFCANGYCCNNACSGSCDACDVPGSLGTCTNVCISGCTGTLGFPKAPLAPPSVVLAGNNIGIDAADFDNNGTLDIVVINQSGNAGVFMGQGNLTLGAPFTLALAANPLAVATGDLNADGFADIVVARNVTGGVSVFLNQGNGTFAPKVDYATGSVDAYYAQPDMLRIADVNGDAVLDIATANTSAGTISLLLGQGNGTFPNKVDIAADLQPTALAIADYNGDSIVDLAVTTQATASSDYRVSVMMGLGGAAFGPATHINTPNYQGFTLATADINGDGLRDLVSGNRFSGYSTWDHKLYVLLNQGNGTFATAVPYSVSAVARVVTTNLNGDAFADVVVATSQLESIAVYLGQASGTLTTPIEYPTPDDAFSLVAADLDNDNDKDIVTANVDSLSVLGNSATGTFGDVVNPDPKVSAAGNILFSGDFNGDGILDLATVADAYYTSTIVISLGQGGGNFIAGTPQDCQSPAFSVTGRAMGDMNGDGKPDLVYCDGLNGRCYIRFYQGNGTFGAATTIDFYNIFDNIMGAAGPILGDVDGNGTLDMIVSRSYTTQSFNGLQANIKTLVWLNPGTGVLGSPVTQTHYTSIISSGSDNSRPTTGGDFNGDGKFDLAISSPRLLGTRILLSSGNGNFTFGGLLPEVDNISAVHVNGDNAIDLMGTMYTNGQDITNAWLNIGGGTFATGVAYSELTGILPQTGDMNGDGKLDFVFRSGGNKVTVKLNQGNGVYGSPKAYVAGADTGGFVLSDLNGDGRLDMAVQNAASSSITIHINTCLP